MNIKKIIGGFGVSSVFAGLFTGVAIEIGVLKTAGIFLSAAVLSAILMGSLSLWMDN